MCRGRGTVDACGLCEALAGVFFGDLFAVAGLGPAEEEEVDVVGGADDCECD